MAGGYALIVIVALISRWDCTPREYRTGGPRGAEVAASKTAPQPNSRQQAPNPGVAAAKAVAADPTIASDLALLHDLIAKRAWARGRALADSLAQRLGDVSGSAVTGATADVAERETVSRASELKRTLETERAALETFEITVFDAAHDVLWAPENARKGEELLLARVARTFGLPVGDVKSILILHDERGGARLREVAATADAALEPRCGPEPERSQLDGSMPVVEQYLTSLARNPKPVEVLNCSAPTRGAETCWTTTCDVRGRNALGGTVQNAVRFTLARSLDSSSWRVTSATAL